MTAVGARPSLDAVAPDQQARATVVLGWREGRRMLTRPAYLVIVAGVFLTGLGAVDGLTSAEAYRLLGLVLVYGALATLFAASLVATSSSRSHSDSQLEAAPVDPQLRTLAAGVGVLLGPVAMAGLLTIAMAAVDLGFEPQLDGAFTGGEYLQLPLSWLGAGLLGVALARWLPWPGVPLVALFGLIAWTMWSANLLDDGQHAGLLMPFVVSSQDALGLGTTSAGAHLGWHAVYLLGLCLLALAAALLRHRGLRHRAVAGFGVLAVALTASAAWLQLP